MAVETGCVADVSPSIANVVQALADWWTRPDAERVALWSTAEYLDEISVLWEEVLHSSAEPLRAMLAEVSREQASLPAEYERLFVGPAAVPCPPYEAVWRTDRPKHEQGTVMGSSTLQVKELYSELGIRLRPDQTELADHIAIELEALAFALAIGKQQPAAVLLQALRNWLPHFFSSVSGASSSEFYRRLAGITGEAISSAALCSPGSEKRSSQ